MIKYLILLLLFSPPQTKHKHLVIVRKTLVINITDMIGEEIVSIDSTKSACEGKLVTRDRYGFKQYDDIPSWFFKVYKKGDKIK